MVVLRSGLPSRPEDEHPQFVDAFNAYSPAGDVTAGLVYVNYGRWRAGWCMFPSVSDTVWHLRLEDLAVLENLGVSLEGRIAIARCSNNCTWSAAIGMARYTGETG